MKALRFYQFGDFSQLKLEEIQEGTAASREVNVRVVAASINPSDAGNVV